MLADWSTTRPLPFFLRPCYPRIVPLVDVNGLSNNYAFHERGPATLTLNRPEQANAMNPLMAKELAQQRLISRR